jgi:hypothetical protein
MRKLTVLATSALAISLLASGSAFAATANATATITSAIAIANGSALKFGLIIPSVGTAGTVTIDPTLTGYPSRSFTVVTLLSGAGGADPSSFAVTGSDSLTYAITLPENGVVTLTGPGGADPMTVNDFVSSPTVAAGGALTSGAQTLKVGATLGVGAAQATGNYTGSYTVTVAYN